MALALVTSDADPRPSWTDFVGGSYETDIRAILEAFPTGTDRAVMHTVAHCYRVRPPGIIIRTAVVRWLGTWTHDDIVACAYLTGTASPKNPVSYMDAILRRWETGDRGRRKKTQHGCAGCGGDLGLDHSGYMGRKYCSSCHDKQAWLV